MNIFGITLDVSEQERSCQGKQDIFSLSLITNLIKDNENINTQL